jgi:putative peptide zinc metalloprotease protein
VVRRVVEAGDVGYLVFDPVRCLHFRQDALTQDLCRLLDGRKDPDDVLEAMRVKYPQYTFSREYLDETLDNLQQSGFLEDAFHRNLLVQARAREARKRLLSAESFKNVLNIQLGTVDPLPLLRRIYPYARVVFSRLWVAGVALATLVAGGILWENREALVGNLATIFSLENSTWLGLLILYVTLFLIVVAHEFGHGLCCMHYGGEPRKLGFLFLYFMPGMYCDVSDIYFFEKRWPRAAVALAGGYVELQACVLGTFVWALTPPDLLLHDIAYRVMLFSGVTGLIFNYNPLIKLDGYFVLMSWLDIPDLRERSFAWLRGNARRLFGDRAVELERATRRERRAFWLYGLLATAYSLFFLWIALLLVKSVLVSNFREAGFAAFTLFFLYVTRGFWKGTGRNIRLLVLERAGWMRRRWALVLGGAGVVVAAFLVPLPHWPKVNAVLAPLETYAIRAPFEGRVQAVVVPDAAPVREGTVLAVLARPEWDQAPLAERAAEEAARLAERRERAATRRAAPFPHWEYTARRAAAEYAGYQLLLTAPFAGHVLDLRPESVVGRYVDEGDSVLTVGRLDTLAVWLDWSEREIADAASGAPAEMRLRASAGQVHRFALERVDWAPSREPVRGAGAVGLAEGDGLAVRYRAVGRIPNPDGRLRPGQTGVVMVRARPLSLAERVGRAYARLVRAEFWL